MSKLSPILKILAFFPPFLLIIGTAGMMSCGGSLFATVTATTTATNTSTSTGTATPSVMAFATNFNSGTISEFTRNTSTGSLTLQGTVSAGSGKGPKGMAITSDNSFLYATNFTNGTVLQYSVGTNAALTSLGSVSDGSGSGPEIIAINPASSFLWVTNNNGTISGWSIGSSGRLTAVQTVSGLRGPFGLTVNSAGSLLYVADSAAGLIYTFTINSSGQLAQNGSPVQSLGTANGNPGLMVIDPTGQFLYVDDLTNGVVSVFNITSGTPVFGGNFPSTFSSTSPVGIDVASLSSGTFVLTANQGTNNTWAFQIASGGQLIVPPLATGSVNNPTGLAVDPLDQFAYTADQGDGTVGIFQLNVGCPTIVQTVCQIGTVATETNPPAGGSAPFDVILSN